MVIRKHYQTKRAIGVNALAVLSVVAVALFCGSATASITSSNKPVHAADSPAKVTVSVDEACSLSGHVDTEHTLTNPTIGAWNPGIGTTSITAVCNDAGGYDIYAVGYSGDEWKNTNLINTSDSSITIGTRDYDSSYTGSSYWSMQLSQGTGDKATIVSPYSNYSAVPSDYTKVATYPSNTTGASGSSFKTTYGVYLTNAQTPGTYQGQVKYTLVHPNGAEAPEAKDPDISTATYMQDVEACPSTLTTGQTYTLTDKRDGEQYIVAKLADDRCWMLDNLRLDPTSITLDILKGNTNASDTTLGYLKNGSGIPPYAYTAIVNETDSWSVAPNIRILYYSPYINADYKNNTSATYGPGSGKVGAYYNYCAASAGSYCYNINTPSSDPDPDSLIDAKEDLCPTGWRMPTGGSTGEYQALYAAYGDSLTDFRSAFSVSLSGTFFEKQQYLDTHSMLWTSTYADGSYMYILGLNKSNEIYTADRSIRYSGRSMRCIVK